VSTTTTRSEIVLNLEFGAERRRARGAGSHDEWPLAILGDVEQRAAS
jgi:hypothetical protein